MKRRRVAVCRPTALAAIGYRMKSNKPYLLISACLLGEGCRYDGRSVPEALATDKYTARQVLERLRERFVLVPVCPEVAGGLPVPRLPSERVGERVVRCDGEDVTEAYRRGAACATSMARAYGARVALLKAKSPSCGKGRIYDGTFSRTLCDGNGVTVDCLLAEGVTVYTEQELARVLGEDEKK